MLIRAFSNYLYFMIILWVFNCLKLIMSKNIKNNNYILIFVIINHKLTKKINIKLIY